MSKLSTLVVLPLVLLAACSSTGTSSTSPAPPPSADTWAMHGTWTDSCCCTVPCPCLFGSKPTEGYCEGASLFQVNSGHYGETALDGVSAVAAYRVGKWTRLYVDEDATPEQVAAFGSMLPELLPFVNKAGEPTVLTADIDVERTGESVRFSVPEATVDLTLVESASGEPITLEGLPAKGSPFPQATGHTQYRSTEMSHSSEKGEFEYSERNGFVSQLAVSGRI
jgi:hypothetical protein